MVKIFQLLLLTTINRIETLLSIFVIDQEWGQHSRLLAELFFAFVSVHKNEEKEQV